MDGGFVQGSHRLVKVGLSRYAILNLRLLFCTCKVNMMSQSIKITQVPGLTTCACTTSLNGRKAVWVGTGSMARDLQFTAYGTKAQVRYDMICIDFIKSRIYIFMNSMICIDL